MCEPHTFFYSSEMGTVTGQVTLYFCILINTLLTPHRVIGTECVIEKVEDCFTNEEDRHVDTRNITVGVLENGKWGLIGSVEVNLRTLTLAEVNHCREKLPLRNHTVFEEGIHPTGDVMVSIEFTKCASKQELETCAYFTTVRQKDACKMIEAENEFWSPFFSNTEPPMRCPMKGWYTFEKSEIDVESASKRLAGLEGFYWKIKTTMFIGKKKVGCYVMALSTI